jgi:hypothetical protein
MLIPITINGIEVLAFINSGVSQNFLSKHFVREWKILTKKKEDPYPLTTADRKLINSY